MSLGQQPTFALMQLNTGHQPALNRLQSRREVQDRLGRVVDVRSELSSGILAIEAEGAFAGIVGLVPSSALDGRDVELVCALLEENEGRGLATAACRQILLEEARAAKRSRILASIAVDNSGGKLLAERLGFTRLGTRVLSSDELWSLPLSSFVAPAV